MIAVGNQARFRREIMVVSEFIYYKRKGFNDIIDITPSVTGVVENSDKKWYGHGILSGSTGAVTTIEYKSGVLEDLKKAIERMAPSDVPYAHDRRWGDGNGFFPCTGRSSRALSHRSVMGGALVLGTWQQIVFIDSKPQEAKKIIVQVIGE